MSLGGDASELEGVVLEVVKDVLRVHVDVGSDLLSLGMTSLGAARVVQALRSRGLAVGSAASVLASGSVRRLAALLSAPAGSKGQGWQHQGGHGLGNGVALQEAINTGMPITGHEWKSGEAGWALSEQQMQMWTMYEMDRGSVAYSIPVSGSACGSA